MSPLAAALAVAVGSAVGALARWQAGVWFNPIWAGFPLGTLFVNALGGLLIGLAFAWLDRYPSEALRLLLVTGGLGGFTTFSAFSAESLALLERGADLHARDSANWTALMDAACYAHPEVCELLLSRRADLMVVSRGG